MKRILVAIGLAAFCMTWVAAGRAAGTPAQKCNVAKNKAAAKKIGAKLKCWQKALATGAASADPACLMAAETKFTTAIGKIDAKGGCVHTGDASTIEGFADQCVSNIVALTSATVACQTANLTCMCGSLTFSTTQACGSPGAPDCTALRNQGAASCTANGQPPDGCITASCTDACIAGQPCG